jgi:hypothetical protein
MSKMNMRTLIFGGLLFVAMAFSGPKHVSGQLVYDFVESSSGNVIGSLEFSSLPAPSSVSPVLSFSSLGETAFGLGPNYLGEFFDRVAVAIDDGMGGLQGSSSPGLGAQLVDQNPPSSSLESGTSADNRFFLIQLDNDAGGDSLTFVGTNVSVTREGDFRLASVPEPSSLATLGFAMVALVVRRRRSAV